jgi:hypothetical protein
MSDPSLVLYQMGEAVSTAINSRVTQSTNDLLDLLSSTNVWTGESNTFNNDVNIGGNLTITDPTYGQVQLGNLTDFEAGLAS